MHPPCVTDMWARTPHVSDTKGGYDQRRANWGLSSNAPSFATFSAVIDVNWTEVVNSPFSVLHWCYVLSDMNSLNLVS
jgi:hypothetical protein